MCIPTMRIYFRAKVLSEELRKSRPFFPPPRIVYPIRGTAGKGSRKLYGTAQPEGHGMGWDGDGDGM